MFKRENIKLILKQINNAPVDVEFLSALRNRLADYIKTAPLIVRIPEGGRPLFKRSNNLIYRFKIMPIPLIIGLIIALASGGTVAASQNSLPGDTLYPVKILSEDAVVAMVFSPEQKAEFRLNLAQKRIEEIGKVLEEAKEKGNGRSAAALQKALNNFDAQVQKILDKTAEIKEKGNLAKAGEITANLETNLGIYKKILKDKEEKSEGSVKNKLGEAGSLVEKNREKARKEKEDIDQEEEKTAGTKGSAEGKINAAENKIAEVEKFIQNKEEKLGVEAITEAKAGLEEAKGELSKAKEHLNKGEYKEAFDGAKIAMNSAIKTKALVQLGASFDREKIKEQDEDKGKENGDKERGKNATSTVSQNATSTLKKMENKDKSENKEKAGKPDEDNND